MVRGRDRTTDHGAMFNDQPKLQNDPHFRDHLLFYAYFHGPGAARPSVNPGTTNMGR
jgi:hypothetical protein